MRFGEVVRFAGGLVDPREEPYSSMVHLGPDNIAVGGARVIGDLKTAATLELISGKYLFDAHAIVYSKIRPNLNKVCIPRFVGICSADMYPIWADEDYVDPNFLCHVMRSPGFVRNAVATSMRTGMPKINRADLECLPIDVPSKKIQQRIAEILHAWDEAIETTERLVAAKRLGFGAFSVALLKGHKRLSSDNSNWPNVSFSDVTRELRDRNSGRFGTDAVMGVNKIHGMVAMKEHVRAEDLSQYKIVPPCSFAYNPMRLNIGSLAMNTHSREVLVSPDYVAFATLDDRLDYRFFDHLRRSSIWSDFVASAGTGSVRIRIYYEHLRGLSFHLPNVAIQSRIADVIDAATREIDILKRQVKLLDRQRRGLMQKLLTGEWRVPLRDGEITELVERAAEGVTS
jgi:type I restriction enzyme S subunit